MSFSNFGLSENILRALKECGYDQPTPIQTKAIPAVLAGGDLLAGAQTGTGKTAGFVLPILQRLTDNPISNRGGRPAIRALIMTPTRELAAQVEKNVREYARHLPITSMVMFGGVNGRPQIKQLQRQVDILVATPGRLLDHAQQGNVDLSRVEILVLDEADRMLDMGFIRDIKRILKLLPQKRQNLLFSATFSSEIKQLADSLLNKPAMIEVARRNAAAESVEQTVYQVDRDKKRELLSCLIGENNWQQVLVFTRTKHGANRLSGQLETDGITSMAIHGNKSQGARTRALEQFKAGKVRVLVATDIAARGIDISELPHVVNYDLPNVSEDYVHRIGRTGRAGSSGEAISLVCVDEKKLLADIEKLLKRELPRKIEQGFEPDMNAKPQPIKMGGGNRQGNGGGRGRNNANKPRGANNARGASNARPNMSAPKKKKAVKPSQARRNQRRAASAS